ncbi:MAG: class I tRNA ligase family protein, partial [Moraxellaceae bacterium]|nr:class I tRNA ligase family protein [Moraxellaceae bacterium]
VGKIIKMSKSKNNGVDPQETIDKFGADTVRLYTMFTAPAEQTLEWSDDALKGPHNFLKKVWKIASEHQTLVADKTLDLTKIEQKNLDDASKKLRRKTHETIEKIDNDLGERMALNTPVSSLMELSNEIISYKVNADNEQSILVQHEALITLLTLLAIYAPHVAEYLLEVFAVDTVNLIYPSLDKSALVQDSITMVVQVNGKVRGKMQVAPNSDPETLKTQAKAIESVAKYLETGEIKKEIVVPNKLVNIVVVG